MHKMKVPNKNQKVQFSNLSLIENKQTKNISIPRKMAIGQYFPMPNDFELELMVKLYIIKTQQDLIEKKRKDQEVYKILIR